MKRKGGARARHLGMTLVLSDLEGTLDLGVYSDTININNNVQQKVLT